MASLSSPCGSSSASHTRTSSTSIASYASPSDLIAATKTHVKGYMAHFDASHDYAHIQRVLALSHQILHSELQLQEQCHHRSTPSPKPSPPALHSRISPSSLRTRTPSPPKPQPPPSDRPPTPPSISYDPTTVTLCALLHDVADSKYTHHLPATTDPSTLAQSLLLSLNCPPLLASTVQKIINHISYSHELRNPDRVRDVLQQHPELAIVQDADRLDALGAVGVGRAFTFGGARAREGGMDQTISHFGEKLEGLAGWMKTETGRKMAEVRTERLRVFRGWWVEECAGLRGEGEGEGEGVSGEVVGEAVGREDWLEI